MLLRAHAKTNLVLSVQPGVDATGFHSVKTVMCAFEFADDVEVERRADGEGLSFACEPDPLPAGSDQGANLAWKAASRMAAEFGQPLDVAIRINKAIPSQAGLGGGSSDAAAVVKGLASLWGIPLNDERVVSVTRSLGADVPFFLHEVPSYLEGRGDILCETFAPFRLDAVLVKPAGGVSTGSCYRLLDELEPKAPSCVPAIEALRAGNTDLLLKSLGNNMQLPARRLAPKIEEVMAFLEARQELLAPPLLSGSGSCVVAFVRDAAAARALSGDASDRGWWATPTRTLA